MNKLTSVFAKVLNIDESKITPELSQDNTPSWDSMNAIVLMTEIEKAYGIKFGYNEAMSIKTFGDVEKLLEAKGVTL